MASDTSKDDSLGDCVICLEAIRKRGGVVLICPGCCGNWFHAMCLFQSIDARIRTCPICREMIPNDCLRVLGVSSGRQNQHQQSHRLSQRGGRLNPFAPTGPTTPGRGLPRAIPSLEDASHSIWPSALHEDMPVRHLTFQTRSNPTFTITATSERAGYSCVSHEHIAVSVRIAASLPPTTPRRPVDVLCLIDTSYPPTRFAKLKQALVALRSHLQEQDRLAICTFTTLNGTVHHFKNMSQANKLLSERLVEVLSCNDHRRSLNDGLARANFLLSNRTSRHADACLLVMTDGLMGRGTVQPAAPSSLSHVLSSVIVFDSMHNSNVVQGLTRELSATLISVDESGDLSEALGGALGASMSVIQWSSTCQLSATAGTVLSRVWCGEQQCAIMNETASIEMLPWVDGECRDVIVMLTLPEVATDLNQVILQASITMADGNTGRDVTLSATCGIKRMSSKILPPRNVEVGAQMLRMVAVEELRNISRVADAADIPQARQHCENLLAIIQNNYAFTSGHLLPLALLSELMNIIERLERYQQGGRTLLLDTYLTFSVQRSFYSARGRSNFYQPICSADFQL